MLGVYPKYQKSRVPCGRCDERYTRRFLFEYPSPVRLVGVHFKSWGISPFADVLATELRDR